MLFSDRFTRWLYRGRRPNTVARVLNRGWAVMSALGIAPNYAVTLRVVGRRSGRPISFPLVMVVMDGERYLVSMLGTDVAWVRNLQAALVPILPLLLWSNGRRRRRIA